MSDILVAITTVLFIFFMSIMENNAKENRVCNIITQVLYYIITLLVLTMAVALTYVAIVIPNGRWMVIIIVVACLLCAGVDIYTAIDLKRNMPSKASPRQEREETFLNMDGYSRNWSGFHPAESSRTDKE